MPSPSAPSVPKREAHLVRAAPGTAKPRKRRYRKRTSRALALAQARDDFDPGLVEDKESLTELCNADLATGLMTVAEIAAKYQVTRKFVWSRSHAAAVEYMRTHPALTRAQVGAWLVRPDEAGGIVV